MKFACTSETKRPQNHVPLQREITNVQLSPESLLPDEITRRKSGGAPGSAVTRSKKAGGQNQNNPSKNHPQQNRDNQEEREKEEKAVSEITEFLDELLTSTTSNPNTSSTMAMTESMQSRTATRTPLLNEKNVRPAKISQPAASYTLRSVIRHTGHTPLRGHYVTDVRSDDGRKWLTYNDSATIPQTPESIFNDIEKQKQAYIFFFELN